MISIFDRRVILNDSFITDFRRYIEENSSVTNKVVSKILKNLTTSFELESVKTVKKLLLTTRNKIITNQNYEIKIVFYNLLNFRGFKIITIKQTIDVPNIMVLLNILEAILVDDSRRNYYNSLNEDWYNHRKSDIKEEIILNYKDLLNKKGRMTTDLEHEKTEINGIEIVMFHILVIFNCVKRLKTIYPKKDITFYNELPERNLFNELCLKFFSGHIMDKTTAYIIGAYCSDFILDENCRGILLYVLIFSPIFRNEFYQGINDNLNIAIKKEKFIFDLKEKVTNLCKTDKIREKESKFMLSLIKRYDLLVENYHELYKSKYRLIEFLINLRKSFLYFFLTHKIHDYSEPIKNKKEDSIEIDSAFKEYHYITPVFTLAYIKNPSKLAEKEDIPINTPYNIFMEFVGRIGLNIDNIIM